MLSNMEVMKVVNGYIRVDGGYLVGFSYRSHEEFYPMYCGLDINPNDYTGTTRERFMKILSSADVPTQAKILRGVLEYCPADNEYHADRRQKHKQEIEEMIWRLAFRPSVSADATSNRRYCDGKYLVRFACR